MTTNHRIHQHYRVRNVLLSDDAAALTLEPVKYWGDHPTETVEIDGETFPKAVECEPGETDEPADRTGGKMTEVRVNGDTEFRPDDLVTLTLAYSK